MVGNFEVQPQVLRLPPATRPVAQDDRFAGAAADGLTLDSEMCRRQFGSIGRFWS